MSAPRKRKLRQVIAKNVRLFRLELGLTQTELADLAVWSQRRISQLESGKLSATMDSIEDLALALRKTPADLVTPHKR